MTDPDLDTSHWYEVHLPNSYSYQSMTALDNGTVYFGTSNISDAHQQWQIFAYSSDAYVNYVFRTRAGGNHAFMLAKNWWNGLTSPEYTTPRLSNITGPDASMFWSIGAWDDGTYFIFNINNGSTNHLMIRNDSSLVLNDSSTAIVQYQGFTFRQLDPIADITFNTVNIPTGTNTTNSTISTATPSATLTNIYYYNSYQSGGLSNAAKAAIGASVGIAVVFTSLIVAFLLIRRRRRRAVFRPKGLFMSGGGVGGGDARGGRGFMSRRTFRSTGAEDLQMSSITKSDLDSRETQIHEMEIPSPVSPVTDEAARSVIALKAAKRAWSERPDERKKDEVIRKPLRTSTGGGRSQERETSRNLEPNEKHRNMEPEEKVLLDFRTMGLKKSRSQEPPSPVSPL